MNEDTFRKLVDKDYADNFMTNRIYELTQEEIDQLSQPKESKMTAQQNKTIETLEEQVKMALARGYCYPENSNKVMDSVLVESMTVEVMKVLETREPKEVNMENAAEATEVRVVKTAYSEKEVINFGNYLLSQEREERISEENKRRVTHADLANWRESQ